MKALGLTNLGVYDKDTNVQDNNCEDDMFQGDGSYTEGPDFAPTASPIAVQGGDSPYGLLSFFSG